MKIKDILQIKYGKNQSSVIDKNGKYPIIGTGGIFGYATKYLYNKPSVLIGRKGSINNPMYVDTPFWTVDTLFYTIIDTSKVIPRWFYYYISTLNLNKFNEGTTIPSLTTKTLYEIDVPEHSLNYQQHIVDIIGSIDDKIENNNKIIEKFNNLLKIKTNELLLYKTKKIQLNDIIEECKEKTDIELTPYSVVNTGKVIIQNEQFNKEIAKNIKGKYKKIKKDFFVYNPSRINIGSIGMMEDEIGCVSPIYIAFKCSEEYKIYLLQLLTFEFMIKEINKRCSGSVRQALPFKDLCSIEIYDIERDKLKLYNKYCENIIRTAKKLEEENLKLQQLKNNYLAKFF